MVSMFASSSEDCCRSPIEPNQRQKKLFAACKLICLITFSFSEYNVILTKNVSLVQVRHYLDFAVMKFNTCYFGVNHNYSLKTKNNVQI
jgi:tetrahydromethanopterin S-methyltransferase subunit C